MYGSIKAQHQRTILLDFIVHLADYDLLGRADRLFAKDRRTAGAAIACVASDAGSAARSKRRLYLVRFVDLIAHLKACMARAYA